MGKKRRILLAMLVLAVLVMAAFVLMSNSSSLTGNELFRGTPESVWIQNLKYFDEAQVQEWRQYGDEGVRVLLRGWARANHPYQRAYRKIWNRLPAIFRRVLPAPKMDSTRATRMAIADVLSRLGNDAKLAEPAMARAIDDEARGVRLLAINYFTGGEDKNAPLNLLDKREKRRLLPAFINAMNDDEWAVRNNAAVALRYYPEDARLVSPVLIKALQDPNQQVRNVAASSLKKVDPQAAAKAGIK